MKTSFNRKYGIANSRKLQKHDFSRNVHVRNISWRITRLASSNQGSSTQFRRLGRIDARDWTRERRVISRRHKMRAAGVEVTTAGNEDKGSRRRPTGKCISTRYHLPVFYPRYAYTPIRAYVRDACARAPASRALYVRRANRREPRCV